MQIRYLILWLLICCKLSFAQGFKIYENNDFLEPKYFNPKVLGLDSVNKIYFQKFGGGLGLFYSFPKEEVKSNIASTKLKAYYTFYSKYIQVGIKLFDSYERRNSPSKKDSFINTFNPNFQIGFYPLIIGDSSMLQLGRLQFAYSPAFKNGTLDNILSADYSIKTSFFTQENQPRFIIVNESFYWNPTKKSFDYGLSGFGTLYYYKTKAFLRAIDFDYSYFRINRNGVDKTESFKIGLIAECLQANKIADLYLLFNYSYNYTLGLGIYNFGIYYDFPITSNLIFR